MSNIKTKHLSRSVRDKLVKHCNDIKKLSKTMKGQDDSASVLQHGIQALLRGLDTSTRDYIYERVETVLLAEEDSAECMVNPQLLDAFNQLQHPLRVGIILKKVTDNFMTQVDKIEDNTQIQYDIYRSIIMRLLMELPYKQLDEMLHRIAPDMAQQKFTENSRHMFG